MRRVFVKGGVLAENGEHIRLRGEALGGYFNMEHFINAYPGSEYTFRYAVDFAIGEDKATFFFEK